ncbi:YceI family protein [Flavobacteriaceae bacterium]|nr:YceI family protein [Flavobacteriaceae bacterium]
MKKLLLLGAIGIFLISCSSDKNYKVDSEQSKIIWTAYKTTEKVPVQGEFKEVTVMGAQGNSIIEAINNTKFDVPVSSIFTNNPDRDKKITDHFFSVLINSLDLTGSLHLNEDNTAYAELTFNGIGEKLPMTYEIKDNTVYLNGEMQLADWDALEGVKSINDACYDLHKGADGVSKTWDVVSIALTIPVSSK